MQTLVLADFVSDQIKMHVADPLLNVATVLIPAVVLLSGLHKMMDHRESGGAFLVEMVTKGGGAVAVLQLIKVLVAGA